MVGKDIFFDLMVERRSQARIIEEPPLLAESKR